MTDKKFRSYLDRLRENVEVLDEAIATAHVMSKSKKKADKAAALQWAKTLRDLVELRNTTLGNIKVHLLGRNEAGAPNEPRDIWESNSQIEYERYFKNQLSPWSSDNLKLKCRDCGVKSEDVSDHYVQDINDHLDLCLKCYEKHVQSTNAEADGAGAVVEPASRHEIDGIRQSATLMIKVIKTLPPNQRIAELERLLAERAQIAPGMEPAYEAYVGVLQKALDDAKAESRS